MSQTVQPSEGAVLAPVEGGEKRVAALEKKGKTRAFTGWLWGSLAMSAGVHLVVFSVAVVVVVFWARSPKEDDGEQIIIPSSFNDPSLSTGKVQGIPSAGAEDPSQAEEQKRMRDALKSDGFAAAQNVNVADLLRGPKSDTDLIAGGGGGRNFGGSGQTDGEASLYGAPSSGAEVGPRTDFLGSKGNAKRIVYLIDRTGSLVDSFGRAGAIESGTVKEQVQRSVAKLLPVQMFALVVFTGREDGGASVVGPAQLLRATGDNKSFVLNKFRDEVVAQGGDSENEILFEDAFRTAFGLKPQLIFFLTDGDMSPKVLDYVQALNRDHGVKINTIVFTHEGIGGATKEDQVRIGRLAKENGGAPEVVTVGDLH